MGYATTASAQDQIWLKDRRYGEGIGIRTGDFELHPGIGGEFGYDSNYFLRASNENPAPSLRARITPSITLSTVGQERREGESGAAEPPKVSFRAAVAGTYMEFIALDKADSNDFSEQRNIAGVGSLQLTIMPRRPFSGDIYADALRSVQPSNDANFNFNRFTTRAGAGLTWAPGGGMFDWRIGYEFGLTYFQDTAFRDLSNETHTFSTRGRWRFLPRTAVLYDGSVGITNYHLNPQNGQLDSMPVRTRLGLNGLITRQLSLLAMAGWGSSFYKGLNAQQYDGIIAQAELKWFITPGVGNELLGGPLPISTAALGYKRDFYNSYLGDYFLADRFYLTLSHLFSGRFLLVIDGAYTPTSFPTIYQGNRTMPTHEAFTAPRVDATAFGEYRLSDTFGINITTRYSANITDVIVQNDNLGWNRFEAFLGVRWFL
jgi:hypothetical protein